MDMLHGFSRYWRPLLRCLLAVGLAFALASVASSRPKIEKLRHVSGFFALKSIVRGDVSYIGQLEDDLVDLIRFLRGRGFEAKFCLVATRAAPGWLFGLRGRLRRGHLEFLR
jgi:hypothetical protein